MVRGVGPKPTTGPDGEPLWMVMKSVATELVNFRVWPETAPLIVEYSPAKEHVEIVVRALPEMVAEPNDELNVH